MEVEHIVIHLNPKAVKRIMRIMRRLHYGSLEEFIIEAIAEKLRQTG